MALDWALTWAGVSAVSAIIQAVKAALDTGITAREEILAVAAEAEEKATADHETAVKAGDELEAFDEEMQEVIRRKIKKAKEKWIDTIDNADDQADIDHATDVLKRDTCGILRTIKRINGGILPKEWQKLWSDNQCA